MFWDQWVLLGTLAAMVALFIWERWRYDIIACMVLLFLVAVGIVPGERAFAGFGEPAVVTVVAVFLVSRGLQNSGVVSWITQYLSVIGERPLLQLGALTTLITVLSGFMNNVGALALLMPVALQTARRLQSSPSLFLMPMAFGSLLGGMMTLIGTPPNIIIASARTRAMGESFATFDFAWVGVPVAVVGVIFLCLIGWRLLPMRRGGTDSEGIFETESYFTELRVPAKTAFIGKTIQELEQAVKRDLIVLAIVRRGQRIANPTRYEKLRTNDVLVVEADPETLESIVHTTGLKVAPDKELEKEIIGGEDVQIMEAIVMSNGSLAGRQAGRLRLRFRFGVNLLGVARHGTRMRGRFHQVRLRVGDVLLLRGSKEGLQELLQTTGALPLAERGVSIQPQRILPALGLFAVGLGLAASGAYPIQVAFFGVVLAMVLTGMLALRELYEAVDWPIVVLLGALMPVGEAFEQTQTAGLVAQQIAALGSYLPPSGVLALLLVGTMFLSDIINNAAAALLMAPIAIEVSRTLGLSADPFLMAVAIGASCAFLTPIGHQCSALVMSPGGYRFGDYWRLGLPLEILITLISLPALWFFWPL